MCGPTEASRFLSAKKYRKHENLIIYILKFVKYEEWYNLQANDPKQGDHHLVWGDNKSIQKQQQPHQCKSMSNHKAHLVDLGILYQAESGAV